MCVWVLVVVCVVGSASAQDAGGSCAGAAAGAGVGGFVLALLLAAAVWYLRKLYWSKRKGKHLVLSTDPESVKDEFAFDNPGFRWQHDAPTLPLGGVGSKTHTHQTQAVHSTPLATAPHSKDDSQIQDGSIRVVRLWARDFAGLGFRVDGGAKQVTVHSVMRAGPAHNLLHPGDVIRSVTINLVGAPLEDAAAILSLASPYPVTLEVAGGAGGTLKGAGRDISHPLLRRAGSTGDVATLEKEGKLLHPPQSPNTSHSNNSTLETKQKGGIKKIITEKIITSTTLERNKKEKKEPTTLERENEKNNKLSQKTRHSDVITSGKPDRTNLRHSTGSDVQTIQHENGIAYIEHLEMQKTENDPKKGMKFGIRVLPPNVPDDGVLKQKTVENGSVTVDKKSIDEPDKREERPMSMPPQIKHENENDTKKPVVAKRREKLAPPIPNVRTKLTEPDTNARHDRSQTPERTFSTFARDDLNSSGIKRDENGIPQELPQHMFDAAKAARINRKSSIEVLEHKKEEAPKPPKKSKGKAPSPPDADKNKSDDSIMEQLKNLHDFLQNEKQHSSLLYDSVASTNKSSLSTFNTSTPNKSKSSSRLEESINFSQDDIDDIVSKPFKRESDSLNNFYEDSKSNLSSNQDVHSVVSFAHSDKSDKGSTTIELNNSDITIHSSPTNDTVTVDTSMLDDNERKAASLGDLSRFELRTKVSKPSTGTLERAQSLDISAEDAENQETALSPKKRKAMSVVETTFFDTSSQDVLPEMIDSDKGIIIKHNEPRLSLNIAKSSAIEGLSTFQRNRLKKGSEFGNLEDAIVKGSSSSIDSDNVAVSNMQTSNIKLTHDNEDHETSDHLAKRIMDENMKVHLKLVSEFAKSTSDNSNISSIDSTQELSHIDSPPKYEPKLMTYDTNIPDDMKVSRNTYVNSLERPKSEMMKKLLAKNPILNVHIDQTVQHEPSSSSTPIETPTPMTDASKALHQPDIVKFDLKSSERLRDYDEYVSNIKVGSNNSFKHNKKPSPEPYSVEWSEPKSSKTNIVTINTTEKATSRHSDEPTHRTSQSKSIEIGSLLIPDVIEGIQRHSDERKEGRTIYMEPANMSITMKETPVQKTVTVNVAQDEFGNKVITQNVEKVTTEYLSSPGEVPLQVEQISFGMMKSPGDINVTQLEEGDVKDIDRKVLEKIKKQNPNLHFTSQDPVYTKTETIILNTELDEEQAKALMEKLKNDPSFMSQKSPEELSKLGITIIHDLEDIQNVSQNKVEVTKTRYSVNPVVASKKTQADHVTEIQVVTPRTEKMTKQKVEPVKDKVSSRQRAPAFEEPPLSYELDIELLTAFIDNERRYSARQMAAARKPRSTGIKFRTATYESPKGALLTSTDLDTRRLSQQDREQLHASAPRPQPLPKPSAIPVKAPKPPVSRIPVAGRALSPDSRPERPLSPGSGDISVTAVVKSSSRSPSGGKIN